MTFRFIDLDHPTSDNPDFTIRKVVPTLTEMFFVFLMLVITGMCLILFVPNIWTLSALTFMMIGISAVYATSQTHKHRDKQRSTEFLNALFASALAKQTRFCAIVRPDGTIVYGNPGFNALFGNDAKSNTMQHCLQTAKVSPAHIEKLLGIIQAGTGATLPIDDAASTIMVSIEPIERPQGFMLVRGVDYP